MNTPSQPASAASDRPVWITGARGLIGNYLVQTAPVYAPHFRMIPLSRARVDLADTAALGAIFHEQQPQLVIHCAGLSKSPPCQADPALAWKLNVEVTA